MVFLLINNDTQLSPLFPGTKYTKMNLHTMRGSQHQMLDSLQRFTSLPSPQIAAIETHFGVHRCHLHSLYELQC
jgi:hypothetical protein